MHKRSRALRHALRICTGCTLVWALANSAYAQSPSNPTVSAGAASISGLGTTSVVVNQSTDKAVIDWSSFSIPAGSSVAFRQPGAGSIALNRVTGTTATQIDGALTSNGQVWLLNPNGVLIGSGGQVQVSGLLATTHAISNADFLSGQYRFDGATASGQVVNRGSIIANGGYAILAGNLVANEGLVQARLGQVVLGAGNSYALDIVGDRLLSFAVTQPVTVVASGPGLVSNTGTLSAQGGTVVMTARAAADVVGSVVNTTGLIDATAVRNEGGAIVLDGGDSGLVYAAGTIDASGKAAAQTGGSIAVLGKGVVVGAGALLDASGSAGGGTINVGGGWQGASVHGHASAMLAGVDASATLNASAIDQGDGGEITLWSDVTNPASQTLAYGTFLSRGGASGGNGGRIETSGHYLDTTGVRGSAAAPLGKAGLWLFDPYDVEIVDSASPNIVNPDFSQGLTGWNPSTYLGTLESVTTAYAYDGTAYQSPVGAGGTFLLATGLPAPGTGTTGYAELTQNFTGTAGQTLSFYSLFLGKNTTAGNDVGLVELVYPDHTGTVYEPTIFDAGSYGTLPWQQRQFSLPQTGTYTILVLSEDFNGPTPNSQFGFVIVPSGTSSANGAFTSAGAGQMWTPANTASKIDVTQITGFLNAGTNVQITTGTAVQGAEAGNITVSAAINKTAGSRATLELDAINNIVVNQSIGSTSGILDVTLNAGGNINLNSTVATNGGTLTFNAGGNTYQSAPFATSLLQLQGGGGNYFLINSGNSFDTISGSTGYAYIADSTPASISGLATSSGLEVTSAGPITVSGTNSFGQNTTLLANGSITLSAGSQSAVGGTFALEATTSFINLAGAGALTNNAAGNWLIYSQDPGGDTFGGLASGNAARWALTPPYLPASLAGPGNQYIFAFSPTVTITASDAHKTYGDTLQATDLPYTVSGLVDASAYGNVFTQDTLSGTPQLSSSGRDATAFAGAYTIAAAQGTLAAPSGYGLAFANGTLTVDPRQLLVMATTDNKTYDGTNISSATPSASGLVNGNTISSLAQSFNSRDAGAKTISVNSGYIVNDGNNGLNYAVTTQSANGTITALALTASLTGSVSKTYDGTAAASLAAGNFLLSGAISGDAVALNDPASGSYDTRNAGGGKTVSVSGLALTGADAGNYTVNPAASAANGTITALALTASLTGSVTRTANGSTAATLTPDNFLLTGIVAGDAVSIAQPVGQYASASAGTGIAVSTTLVPSNFLESNGTLLSNYVLPTGLVSGPIGVILPQVVVVAPQQVAEPAVTRTVGSSLAPAAATPTADAPAGPGAVLTTPPMVVATISPIDVGVEALPASPVPVTLAATPVDSADASDPILTLIAVPGNTPATHPKRQTSVSVPIIDGLLSEQRPLPKRSGKIPGVDLEFSGSGRAL